MLFCQAIIIAITGVEVYYLKCYLEVDDKEGVTASVLVPVLIPFEILHGIHELSEMQFEEPLKFIFFVVDI